MKLDALVTGATAGIGLELARCFARDNHGVVLVARTKERLEKAADELGSAYNIPTKVIVADLSEPSAPQAVYDAVREAGIEIEYLVNNAGFGANGKFWKTSLETELDMMQVNMGSLVALTKLFLKDMTARGSGRILQVASTAAFQPGPNMAIYCASKAFVLSFSEALAVELEGSGVSVTCLCPGGTETEFQARAEITEIPLVKGGMIPRMQAAPVAQRGYAAMMKGTPIAITGLVNKLGALSVRLTPRRLAAKLAGKMMERPT